MFKQIDLKTWKRRQQFELFRHYEQPFFNICAEVDVSQVVRACRGADGPSFFLASLYLSLVAANEIKELRYRLRGAGDQVIEHQVIHGGSTVLLPNETFGFAYFDYHPRFSQFAATAQVELDRVVDGDWNLELDQGEDSLIHYTVLPWVSLTSFSHARRRDPADSIPKIVFGRYRRANAGAYRMPVSVEVHHALADGLHVGRFFERFQAHLDDPATLQGALQA